VVGGADNPNLNWFEILILLASSNVPPIPYTYYKQALDHERRYWTCFL